MTGIQHAAAGARGTTAAAALPWARRGAGVLLLAALWGGPLPPLAHVSMTAHMILHVAVVAAVPALLAARLPLRPGMGLLVGAALADLIVVWGWHLPTAHVWASLDDTGFVLQQASFLLVGLFVWSVAEAAGALGASALLLATGMHMTLIGALISLAPQVLYNGVCGGGPFGLSPLEDQQMGGVVMAVVAPTLFFGAGLIRLAPILRDSEA